jgi:hypothetical protein
MARKPKPKPQTPKKEKKERDLNSGRPETGSGEGRRDHTGVMPDFRVDPDVTEGHPGYQESGDSEIIPNERLTKKTPSENE